MQRRRKVDAASNSAAKYADEFRRETAGYIISTERPISKCCRKFVLDSKTVNQWAIKRRCEISSDPNPKAKNREPRKTKRRIWVGRTYLDDFKKTKPAFLNSAKAMWSRSNTPEIVIPKHIVCQLDLQIASRFEHPAKGGLRLLSSVIQIMHWLGQYDRRQESRDDVLGERNR